MGAFRVKGFKGVAFYKLGGQKKGRVKVCMVGDDRVFVVDAADCEPLKDSQFCRECGQIGCTCYVVSVVTEFRDYLNKAWEDGCYLKIEK